MKRSPLLPHYRKAPPRWQRVLWAVAVFVGVFFFVLIAGLLYQ